MGLDVVELVMRCEEEFSVALDYHRLEPIRTVGELFELICGQLNLPDTLQPVHRRRGVATVDGWDRDAVWAELVRLCAEQFQVAADKVTYTARFVDDFGAD